MLNGKNIRQLYLDDSDELDDLGIGYFSVYECALIICQFKYYDGGGHGILYDDEKSYRDFSDEFIEYLEKPILELSERVIEAIEKRDIKPTITRKTIDEKIIPAETLISFEVFDKWAYERGLIRHNKNYSTMVCSYQGDLYSAASDAIDTERLKKRFPKKNENTEKDMEAEILTLKDQNKDLINKITQLEKEASSFKETKETELSPKSLTSLSKLVLAMAIKKFRHDPVAAKNSSTQNITDAIHELGMDINADTVRHWLKTAADQLEGEYEITKPN